MTKVLGINGKKESMGDRGNRSYCRTEERIIEHMFESDILKVVTGKYD